MIASVAALAVVALVVVVMALNRDSSLTTPSQSCRRAQAVSASSSPVAVQSVASPAPASSGVASPVASVSVAPALPVVASSGTLHCRRRSDLPGDEVVIAGVQQYGWHEQNFGVAGTGYSTGGKTGGRRTRRR